MAHKRDGVALLQATQYDTRRYDDSCKTPVEFAQFRGAR
jgi:hypothetical protein